MDGLFSSWSVLIQFKYKPLESVLQALCYAQSEEVEADLSKEFQQNNFPLEMQFHQDVDQNHVAVYFS